MIIIGVTTTTITNCYTSVGLRPGFPSCEACIVATAGKASSIIIIIIIITAVLSLLQCRPQAGFSFMRGAYRCDCRQGFEYHHLDGKFWIEGSLVELEYEKKVRGIFSR